MDEYSMYLRKSRADLEAEERGEKEILARHERALMDLAHKNGHTISHIYREIVSGDSIAARPEMQKLLADVDAGRWKGTYVMEVERLARGETIDQGIVAQAFIYSGTFIITPAKTFDPDDESDMEYLEFGLFMSRREYRTINRRLKAGMLASSKEGKYIGNKAPYGYIRVKLAKQKGFTLEPDPEEAPVVRLIFDWYVNGVPQEDGSTKRIGTALIARRLNDMGIRPKYADVWVPVTIRDMIRNVVYIGKIRRNRRSVVRRVVNGQKTASRPRSEKYDVYDGLHEGIIDPEVFAKAQEITSQYPPGPVPAGRAVVNPLSGLVVCGLCGRRMVRRPYYKNCRPDTLLCYSTACPNVSSDLYLVENRILEALGMWLQEYKVRWQTGQERPSGSSLKAARGMLKKAAQELGELEKQKGNLHDLLERGIYDADTFASRNRDLSGRIDLARQRVGALEAEIAQEIERDESRRVIIPRVEHLLTVYNEIPSPAEKNALLKEVLEKVVYFKEDHGHGHRIPEDFKITLYPRLQAKKS